MMLVESDPGILLDRVAEGGGIRIVNGGQDGSWRICLDDNLFGERADHRRAHHPVARLPGRARTDGQHLAGEPAAL